jgi:hypothetical protein
MVNKDKQMPEKEARKGQVLQFGSQAPGSESQKGQRGMALDEPLENEIRDHEEQRFSFSNSLEAGWQALTLAARSEVNMEDFADSLADGSLLASVRYYFAIRKEARRVRSRNTQPIQGR